MKSEREQQERIQRKWQLYIISHHVLKEPAMHPRERFIQAMNRQEPDQVPVCPWLTSDFFQGTYNLSAEEWYGSLDHQLKAMLEFYERFPDMQYFPGFRASYGSTVEASSLGCKVVWPKDATPYAEPVIQDLAQDLPRLKVGDPHKDGRMPQVMDLYAELKVRLEPYGYEVTSGFLHGPIDVAAEIRGITDFFMDLYRNPDSIHTILEIVTETCIAFANAQYEAAGKTMLHILISDDSGSQLSRAHWEEFALPYHKRLFESLPEGVVGAIHNCSRISHLIDLYAETGAGMVQFGEDLSVEDAKKKIGDRMSLLGNLSPIGVLSTGTPDEVEAACRRVILVGGEGGGLLLSSSGSVNRNTPVENIEAMVRAAEKYGRYPLLEGSA
jgi:uroporphyrinogen decarboxylase